MTDQKKFEIVCTDELMNKIEEQCFSSTKTEVGGFLVGTIADGKSTVTHVLKAKHTANTQSQLTFTNKTWETAHAEMGEIGADAELIVVTHAATEDALDACVEKLKAMDIVSKVESVIRVEGASV